MAPFRMPLSTQHTSISPPSSMTWIPAGTVRAARPGTPTGTGVSGRNTGGPWLGHSSMKYSLHSSQTVGRHGTREEPRVRSRSLSKRTYLHLMVSVMKINKAGKMDKNRTGCSVAIKPQPYTHKLSTILMLLKARIQSPQEYGAQPRRR